MKSFITGSRAYGSPNESSDIDLVVFVSENELRQLCDAEEENSMLWNEYGGTDAASLRFGVLNLICVTREEDYNIWKQGTKDLISRAPVSRQEAVNHINSLRFKQMGSDENLAEDTKGSKNSSPNKSSSTSGLIDDPENYAQMIIPHETLDAGAQAWASFYKEVYELRKKYRIAEVVLIGQVRWKDEKTEAIMGANSTGFMGNELSVLKMLAKAYGEMKSNFKTC